MTNLDDISIRAHAGTYRVQFCEDVFEELEQLPVDSCHLIIDHNVASLYQERLQAIMCDASALIVNAEENAKSIEQISAHASALCGNRLRRDHLLVAVGGGIIQDVACFLASTLFRGMSWQLFPTTILAQADSCIGSKSSVNVGDFKNLMGTFHPPTQIGIALDFQSTLTNAAIRSGIGEMIKVHIIDGPDSFSDIDREYASLLQSEETMAKFIRRSLVIKKSFIEEDEFDRGSRNILNYGHSFGHAMEAATGFALPHGIAVTIGMELANFVSMSLGRMTEAQHRTMSPLLRTNSAGFDEVRVNLDVFFDALRRDKKRTSPDLSLILLNSQLSPQKVALPEDEKFRSTCSEYLSDRGLV